MRPLQKRFYKLASNYCNNNATIATLWMELEELYGSKRRFYHTLEHLEYIYKVLSGFKLNDALEFAIFYHDSIYFSKNLSLTDYYIHSKVRFFIDNDKFLQD